MNNTAERLSAGASVGNLLGKYWLAILTVATYLVLAALAPSFRTFSNLMTILISACVICISGLGLTCILSTGELDFGAGTELAAGTVIYGLILGYTPIKSIWLALLITIAFMAVYGALNAFLHIKLKIPAFIATFALSYLLKGAGQIVMTKVCKGYTTLYNQRGWPDDFGFFGQSYIGPIPVAVIVLIVVCALVFMYTEGTKWGRYLYAVGANPRACDYLGINSNFQKFLGCVLCAVLCGLAGVRQASMTKTSTITCGDSALMSGLSVMMIGATFLKPGVFNVAGTIVGALLVAMLNNGLVIVGLTQWLRDLISALILLAAIVMVVVFKHRASK